MRLLNRTGFQAAWREGKVRFPAASTTIIVKGTFDLRSGSPATPAKSQEPLSGDEPSDPAELVRYPSDFAWFKPHADLLLVGCAHAPDGKPATALRVSFNVGAYSKTLAVIGDRAWKGVRPTEPMPFAEMDVSYANAFRGGTALPNIEDPARLDTSPDDRPTPAGFGPIPSAWPQRRSKTGTYDKKWLKERWPWIPEDADWTFENAAPPDQQLRN